MLHCRLAACLLGCLLLLLFLHFGRQFADFGIIRTLLFDGRAIVAAKAGAMQRQRLPVCVNDAGDLHIIAARHGSLVLSLSLALSRRSHSLAVLRSLVRSLSLSLSCSLVIFALAVVLVVVVV